MFLFFFLETPDRVVGDDEIKEKEEGGGKKALKE